MNIFILETDEQYKKRKSTECKCEYLQYILCACAADMALVQSSITDPVLCGGLTVSPAVDTRRCNVWPGDVWVTDYPSGEGFPPRSTVLICGTYPLIQQLARNEMVQEYTRGVFPPSLLVTHAPACVRVTLIRAPRLSGWLCVSKRALPS